MINEILALHFTDIKGVFQPVFDGMTSEAKEEMFNIFGGGSSQNDIDKLVNNAYDKGSDEGYKNGYEEGYEEGYENGELNKR